MCTNRARHVRVAPGRFLKSDVIHAALGSAGSLANLRVMAETYGLLHDVHRVHDARLLEHIEWMLETERLIAFECVQAVDWRPIAAPPTRPAPATPSRRPPPPVVDLKTWVEIELRDDAGKPLVGQSYRVIIPGGLVEEGRLDENGRAKISNIDPGMCDITFPDIDAKEWKRA